MHNTGVEDVVSTHNRAEGLLLRPGGQATLQEYGDGDFKQSFTKIKKRIDM